MKRTMVSILPGDAMKIYQVCLWEQKTAAAAATAVVVDADAKNAADG